jgi:hypothetical protein
MLLNAPQLYAFTKLLLMTVEKRKYGVGMASKDIIFMSNFVEIGLLLQKLKWGRQTHTHKLA